MTLGATLKRKDALRHDDQLQFIQAQSSYRSCEEKGVAQEKCVRGWRVGGEPQARSIGEPADRSSGVRILRGPKSEAAIETDPAVIETVDQSPKSLLSPGLGPPRIVRRLPAAEGYVFGRRAARILKLLDRLLHLPGLCICF